MLSERRDDGRLLAGGTALTLIMHHRLFRPGALIDLGGVPGLDGVAIDARQGLRLGAMVRHRTLATHAGIGEHYPIIREMARRIADPQIRNVGTIGGNLCHADPASDPPACLLALRAEVVAVRGADERVIPIDDFFTGPYETALEPDELLTEIRIPPPAAGTVSAYLRFATSSAEHRPMIGVAVVLTLADGVCADARIALGAVTPVPRRLEAAEQCLRGQAPARAALAEAARIAVRTLEPQSDFRGSAEYKRQVAEVIVRRTLELAVERRTS